MLAIIGNRLLPVTALWLCLCLCLCQGWPYTGSNLLRTSSHQLLISLFGPSAKLRQFLHYGRCMSSRRCTSKLSNVVIWLTWNNLFSLSENNIHFPSWYLNCQRILFRVIICIDIKLSIKISFVLVANTLCFCKQLSVRAISNRSSGVKSFEVQMCLEHT